MTTQAKETEILSCCRPTRASTHPKVAGVLALPGVETGDKLQTQIPQEPINSIFRGRIWSLLMLLVVSLQWMAVASAAERIPVIFDTDIGDDIDDTWALVGLLKTDALDLKLVTTTRGKAEYRAKLVARLLNIAGRTDIPIGLGAGGKDGDGAQSAWVSDFKLASYSGTLHEDGVKALIDQLRSATEPITIISVGPSHTVAAALERDPSIASKAIFVGMQGSVRKGYNGGAVAPEYNVKENIPAAQKAMHAHWKKVVITPLDTCGLVKLSGKRFETLNKSTDPLVQALLENYRIWAKKKDVQESSILFDTVAVYLAYPGPKPLLKLEPLSIQVKDNGITAEDPHGLPMWVATEWKDLERYNDWLLELLLRKTSK